MARKPEVAELPTRVLMQALGSDRRYKRILVFGTIGVLVLGGGIFVVARTVDAQNAAAREAAFGGLESCLLGADPLKEGETPSSRIATIKLGVVGTPLDKRGVKAGELGWPASCSAPAYALAEHASGTPLGAASEALGKALRADASATGDEHAEVDKVWAEAATLKLKGAAPPDAPKAPKPPAILFTATQFKELPKFLSGTFPLPDVREETASGSKIYFLIDRKDTPEGPVICTANATDPTVKCMKVPEAVATLSPGLRLIGTTDDGARPYFFAGDRGYLGIFPPDGKHALASGLTYGASAHADGSLDFVTLRKDTKDLHLTHQPATGIATDASVLQPTDFDTSTQSGLFWDWLVNRGTGKTAHLYARKVEGGNVKPATDVGELEEGPPPDKADRDREQVAGCKSDEAIAVRVRGQRGDMVAFYTGGRWSAPVKATTRGGAFTCHGLEAISTTVDHASDRDKDFPTVNQSKCNTSSCTTTKVDLRIVLAGLDIAPADAGGSVAADVGGKLLFLWNAGTVGGLRMRFAPADRIKDAEDTVITDGREEKAGANVSSIAAMRVLTNNSFALVFLSTTAGVKVLRADATGKLTPLQASL